MQHVESSDTTFPVNPFATDPAAALSIMALSLLCGQTEMQLIVRVASQ